MLNVAERAVLGEVSDALTGVVTASNSGKGYTGAVYRDAPFALTRAKLNPHRGAYVVDGERIRQRRCQRRKRHYYGGE